MRWMLVKRWVPLLAWIILIFSVSSIPLVSMDGMGMPEGFDKIVHYFEYLILALLFHHGLSGKPVRKRLPVELLVLAACLAIAAVDEAYQGHVPGRDPSLIDFAADSAGSLTGILIGMRMIRSTAGGAEEA